jgi:hypothetical protein
MCPGEYERLYPLVSVATNRGDKPMVAQRTREEVRSGHRGIIVMLPSADTPLMVPKPTEAETTSSHSFSRRQLENAAAVFDADMDHELGRRGVSFWRSMRAPKAKIRLIEEVVIDILGVTSPGQVVKFDRRMVNQVNLIIHSRLPVALRSVGLTADAPILYNEPTWWACTMDEQRSNYRRIIEALGCYLTY